MQPTELRLLERIARRDQDALMELYRLYCNQVYALVLRVLRHPGLAEEVTQDVFLKVWHQSDRWNPNLGRFHSWLLTMARNAAIDRLRMEGRRPISDALDFEEATAHLHSPAETGGSPWVDGQLLRGLLYQLSEEQRLLIELAFFHGYTHSDLAESLNLPLGTVKTRLRTGIQKLRSLWETAVGV
jgi:RNA polymerase sigma-70 factor (ECF subfamily)